MQPSDTLRERLRGSLRPPEGPHPAPAEGTPAAVLVPLIERDEPALFFTKRTDQLPRHPGEISFPGGLRHPGDRDLLDTALRETEEELGLARADVEVLGSLDPFLTYTTGFWVLPFVGAVRPDPSMTPNPDEIAVLLELPLPMLAGVEREVEWHGEGQSWTGFVYDVEEHTIWGATGRMVHEFLELYREVSA